VRAGGPRPLPSPFGVIIMTETCTCSDRSDTYSEMAYDGYTYEYCHDCDLPLPLPTLETGVAGNGGDL